VPRVPDLKSRRLYSFGRPSAYPSLEPLNTGRINVALIRAHWLEILRVAASIRTGTVTASLILRQLASYPRQNGVAATLRELGRLERTLFTLNWLEDPELRRAANRELNKAESRNRLARAVFIHRLVKSGIAPMRTRTNMCLIPAFVVHCRRMSRRRQYGPGYTRLRHDD
jgi:TnpA family transposase